MPKTGRNIYKRKDGRWEGRYIKRRVCGGKIVYGSVYGKTFTAAKQKLMLCCTESLALTPISTLSPDKSRLTFAQVVSQWLSVISLKVKQSTYASYTSSLDLHILPSLGKLGIRSLTAVDISHFAKEKLETGRIDGKGGLSAKTVRDMLSIINAVIDFAQTEEIITGGLKITYPKQQQQVMRVLSRQEQSSLEAVLTTNIDVRKLGIMLCLYTGIRIGELCALRWEDFSGDFDMLSVRRTLQRVKNTGDGAKKTKIIIDTPKSSRSLRDIPIPKFLMPHLRRFSCVSRSFFLSTDGSGFTEPRSMQNHFARNAKEASIVDANCHSLRHTFATRCIEAGVDVKSLSEMLGHASVSFTLNRYVHSSFDQKREGIKMLEKYTML